MAFVVRIHGYSYGGEEGPGEHVHLCYLTKDGGASTARAQARVYDTEAEAWDHLATCDAVDPLRDFVLLEPAETTPTGRVVPAAEPPNGPHWQFRREEG